MPYPATLVGRRVAPLTRSVTVRRALAYAAGVGATEYLDDAADGGLPVLPFVCVSHEWPVTLAARALGGEALTDDESRRGVHAEQDSLFHRPVRAGETLKTAGVVVAARASRAGAVTVTRFDTIDESGAPVFTSWSTSILRGVPCEGDDRATEAAPPLPTPSRDALESVTVPVRVDAAHVYTECADIWNPIHTERTVARGAGLPDIILHGTATWALAGLEILRRRGAGDIARLRRLRGRFTGMTFPGAPIVVRIGTPDADGAVAFDVVSLGGAPILSDGVALLAAP